MSKIYYPKNEMIMEELEERIVFDASVDVAENDNPDNPDNPDSQGPATPPDAPETKLEYSEDPLGDVLNGDGLITNVLGMSTDSEEVIQTKDGAYTSDTDEIAYPNELEFIFTDPSLKNSDLLEWFVDANADLDGFSFQQVGDGEYITTAENEEIYLYSEDGQLLGSWGNLGKDAFYFFDTIDVTEQQWDRWTQDGRLEFTFKFSPGVQSADGVWDATVDGVYHSANLGYCDDCSFVFTEVSWTTEPYEPPKEPPTDPPYDPPAIPPEELPDFSAEPLVGLESSYYAEGIDPRISYVGSEFNADFIPRPLVPIPNNLFDIDYSGVELEGSYFITTEGFEYNWPADLWEVPEFTDAGAKLNPDKMEWMALKSILSDTNMDFSTIDSQVFLSLHGTSEKIEESPKELNVYCYEAQGVCSLEPIAGPGDEIHYSVSEEAEILPVMEPAMDPQVKKSTRDE